MIFQEAIRTSPTKIKITKKYLETLRDEEFGYECEVEEEWETIKFVPLADVAYISDEMIVYYQWIVDEYLYFFFRRIA